MVIVLAKAQKFVRNCRRCIWGIFKQFERYKKKVTQWDDHLFEMILQFIQCFFKILFVSQSRGGVGG